MDLRTEDGKFKYRAGGEEQRTAADGSWRRGQGSRCVARGQATGSDRLRLPGRGRREEFGEVYVKNRDATSRC